MRIHGISYKWGPSIDNTWQTAFNAAVTNWNLAPTNMFYYYDPNNGKVTFDKEYVSGPSTNYGDTFFNSVGGVQQSCKAFGNTYTTLVNDHFTSNQLQWVATHESGHCFSLGHIANFADGRIVNTILGYHNDFQNVNTPQALNDEFMNQFYP
jgi:hypothetical protein